MYGFENIATHNGWVMAIAGALIVMAGLAVLSFVISQIHKILALMEKRTIDRHEIMEPEERQKLKLPDQFPADICDAARLYEPLIDQLGYRFNLRELYAISQKHGYPHPHLTIKCLREAGILVPEGDGVFSWHR